MGIFHRYGKKFQGFLSKLSFSSISAVNCFKFPRHFDFWIFTFNSCDFLFKISKNVSQLLRHFFHTTFSSFRVLGFSRKRKVLHFFTVAHLCSMGRVITQTGGRVLNVWRNFSNFQRSFLFKSSTEFSLALRFSLVF